VDNITGGGSGERATGTPNTIYDLSSVLFHALEGGASYDTYIEDAEREGDGELADFFRRVRDEDSMRADEAQRNDDRRHGGNGVVRCPADFGRGPARERREGPVREARPTTRRREGLVRQGRSTA
jgi:hypothetical protein